MCVRMYVCVYVCMRVYVCVCMRVSESCIVPLPVEYHEMFEVVTPFVRVLRDSQLFASFVSVRVCV